MAVSQFLAQPLAAQSINASGSTGAIAMNQNFNSVLAQIEVETAPTGTTPVITFQLQVSLDGVHFNNVGAATGNITGVGLTSLSNNNVNAPWIKIVYTVTGTTPVFPSITVNLYVS